MPKENTHLFFAHKIARNLANQNLKEIIKRNLRFFYFGSVVPDTFYYGKGEKIRKISESLHGRYGNLTNEIVFELLDQAKKQKNELDLVFTLGYLTHCALDITFHPIVYYLSGNYYDADPEKANEAIYLHRHLETYLDSRVNHKYFYNDLINYKTLRKLAFSKIISTKFNISIKEQEKTLIRKSILLKALKYDFILNLLYLFYRPSLSKYKMFLGIFYGNLKRDSRIFPDTVKYRDIITGENLITNIQDLFKKSEEFSLRLIDAAYRYYNGEMSREQAKQIIRGESLNTGRLNAPVTEIKYFYNSLTK